MIIYFADRYMKILGMASTGLPDGLIITDDTKKEDIESGVASFSCTLSFYTYDRLELESYCAAGNYILRANGDEQEFYTIIESEIDVDSHTIEIYAEDAGLDLLNNIATKLENTDTHNIAYYVNLYIDNTGFEIGTNEVSDMTKVLAFDSEETVTSRLRSIASGFTYTDSELDKEVGCEIGYSFTIKNLEVTNKYVNIYKKRGVSTGAQLRLGKEVSNITITRSVANLATALLPTGGQNDSNETVTLKGYSYDDGSDFYVDSTTGQLRSRKAMEKWTRFNSDSGSGDSYILKSFSGSSTTQAELKDEALKELKKVCDTEINWDVEITQLPEGIKMGDTIYVIDDAGKNYIQARLLAIESSISQNSTSITLGDYLIKTDGINDKVTQLAENFSEIAKSRTVYTWIAYADDASGTNASLSPYTQSGSTITKKNYIGILENQLEPLENLSQLTPRISELTWAKYAPTYSVGSGDTKIQYAVSTDPTNPPDPTSTVWQDTVPEVSEGEYLYIRNKITASSGTTQAITGNSQALNQNFLSISAISMDVASLEAEAITTSKLQAGTVSTDLINAINLEATSATIDGAQIGELSAEKITTGTMSADRIDADELEAEVATFGYLTSDQLNANYANLNKANIEQAWIQQLMVKGNLVALNGTIYELDAVHFNADMIQANTIKADKLILKSSTDGLYYQLNLDSLGGITAEYSQSDLQSGLLGSNIVAGSITGEQITADEIRGTGGWIRLSDGVKRTYTDSSNVTHTIFEEEDESTGTKSYYYEQSEDVQMTLDSTLVSTVYFRQELTSAQIEAIKTDAITSIRYIEFDDVDTPPKYTVFSYFTLDPTTGTQVTHNFVKISRAKLSDEQVALVYEEDSKKYLDIGDETYEVRTETDSTTGVVSYFIDFSKLAASTEYYADIKTTPIRMYATSTGYYYISNEVVKHTLTAAQQAAMVTTTLNGGTFEFFDSSSTSDNKISWDGSNLEVVANSVKLSSGASMSTMEDDIEDIQSTLNTKIGAWMTFSSDGLTIGKTGSTIRSLQDNDSYQFLDANDNPLLTLDTSGATFGTLNSDVIKLPQNDQNWQIRVDAGGNLNFVYIS